MKLLLDQNLSDRLAPLLQDLFPGSVHVKQLRLEAATDDALWAHALDDDFALVTKDRDFEDEARFSGPPPRCILLATGNAATDEISLLLRDNATSIAAGTGRLLVIKPAEGDVGVR